MGRPITRTSSLPPSGQWTAALISTLGYSEGTWTYEQNYPLADPGKQSQVRDQEEKAGPYEVSRYAEAMKPYTASAKRPNLVMPPVVYTLDGYLLDGNTRNAAAAKLGWDSFPAIVLNDNYASATEPIRARFQVLQMRLNRVHGKNLKDIELYRLIRQLISGDPEPDAAALAQQIQCSQQAVKNVIAARNAETRMTELGITVPGSFTLTHLAIIGQTTSKFYDGPFRHYVEFLRDCAVPGSEIRGLSRQFAGYSSEAAMIAAIDAEAKSREGAKTGHAPVVTRSRQLRTKLSALHGICEWIRAGNKEMLVDITPGSGELNAQVIQQAIIDLRDILMLQTEQNAQPPLAPTFSHTNG
jgi:hypothetical protein